jgi:hypothetical protein
MKDTIRRMLVVAVAATSVVAVNAIPASAHLTQAPVFNTSGQRMGFAEVGANHVSLAVCDTRADNVGVYGRFELTGGGYVDVADPDGSGSICGRVTASSVVKRYMAIARNGRTSGWTEP